MGTSMMVNYKQSTDLDFVIVPGSGPVVQVAHPTSIGRNPIEMISLLIEVSFSRALPDEVELLVTGGGFIELDFGLTKLSRRQLREPAFLKDLHRWTLSNIDEVLRTIGRSPGLDLVVGVDVTVNGQIGVGQFATLISRDGVALVPKRLPVGGESNHLAGVDSTAIDRYPRVFDTRVGSTLLLVCHDVNSVNPRTRALIGRASVPNARTQAIEELDQAVETPGLDWVLNLVHSIDRRRQTQTFGISYRRFNGNIIKGIRVAAGFGYDGVPLENLPQLLDLMVAPKGMSPTKVLIHS